MITTIKMMMMMITKMMMMMMGTLSGRTTSASHIVAALGRRPATDFVILPSLFHRSSHLILFPIPFHHYLHFNPPPNLFQSIHPNFDHNGLLLRPHSDPLCFFSDHILETTVNSAVSKTLPPLNLPLACKP